MNINIAQLRKRGFYIQAWTDSDNEVIALDISAFGDTGNSDIARRAKATIQKAGEHFPELSDEDQDALFDDIMRRIDKRIIMANI